MKVRLFLIVVISNFIFVNCGPVQFTRINRNLGEQEKSGLSVTEATRASSTIIDPPESAPDTVRCSQDSVTVPVKVLFVVDTSGSNALAYRGVGASCDGSLKCVPATDPEKKFRKGSIQEFFEKYKERSNISWGFEIFSRHDVRSYIGEKTNEIFGNAHDMEEALKDFATEKDRGKTPYLKAMEGVQTAISDDPDLRSKAEYPPRYYVVFMSDGYPTDAKADQVKNAVDRLIALSPTQISLSTIYYGTQNDPEAASTLQNMARSGGGQFVNFDTNSNETIAIQDLIGLPTTSCL